MKPSSKFFRISRTQQRGIILLIILLIGVEIILLYKAYNSSPLTVSATQDWMVLQAKVDSLKSIQKQKNVLKIHPFNPNYLNSYRGYVLGLSYQEIERMTQFRKNNNYVNSIEEFQNVTKISDSLLQVISPFFKFPEWVSKPKMKFQSKPLIKKPLNIATAEDLTAVYGVGEILADRILQFRNVIGGFIVTDQLQDVYGLEDATIVNILTKFEIKQPPKIQKRNINTSSIDELNQVPYITYSMARNIVLYRSQKGNIKSFEEIHHLEGFTTKIRKRIPLYLYLENDGENGY